MIDKCCKITFISTLIAILFCIGNANSQVVSVPTSFEVYEFLKKMEAKQLLKDYRDVVKPLSRRTIAKSLLQLEEVTTEMTDLDLETFDYLKMEFAYEMSLSSAIEIPYEFRWHLLSIKLDSGMLFLDPNLRFSWKKDPVWSVSTQTWGLKFFGYVFSNIGYYFNFIDNRESGDYDQNKALTPEQGIITSRIQSALEYDVVDAQLTLQLGKVELALEKMDNQWGFGRRGNIFLSNKPPSYPQFKLRVPISDWMNITYIHSELHSKVVDSARSYVELVGNNTVANRIAYRYKYMAAHMVEFTPLKGLDISLGESVVYSDKIPQLMYLLPLTFFKSGEHYNRDTDNIQFFGAIDLNLIKKINCYASAFIDEISIDKFFQSDDGRKQVGFTVGLQTFDLFLNNVEVLIEYTRLNPWVYSHKYTAATFTNNGYVLGHWIGQNADNLFVDLTFRPSRQLKVGAFYESFRRGVTKTVNYQYDSSQRMSFLEPPVRKEYSIGGYGKYQFIRDGFLEFRIRSFKLTDNQNPSFSHSNRTEFFLSLGYGIW